MKGKHHIIIESNRLKYEFDIRRNITVIQGDSATGKTTLIELLRNYSRLGSSSGILLQSDVNCTVYAGDNTHWSSFFAEVEESIVFIDEDYHFVFSTDFADAIRGSGNYYVIISRRSLKNLPYSTKEIYGIRTVGKYHFPEKVYHEFYPIYTDVFEKGQDMLLLLEDEKSGYQFFQKAVGETKCLSAQGNSGILGRLMELDEDRPIAIIADGAAFGAFVANVVAEMEVRGNCLLYLPESFEWLILKSGIFENKEIEAILDHPEDYVESREYFSWERFFTSVLTKISGEDDYKRYSKEQLSEYYMSKRNIMKVFDVLPDELHIKGLF